MAVRTIAQSIEIQAPRERVWDVLLQDDSYRQWTADFSPGSYAETDWQAGSKAVFRDESGAGLVGRIVTSERPERLDIEYDGLLVDGRDDVESSDATEMKGAHETYRLTERGDTTVLDIESGMSEAHYDGMNEAWVRALRKVKELAESRAH